MRRYNKNRDSSEEPHRVGRYPMCDDTEDCQGAVGWYPVRRRRSISSMADVTGRARCPGPIPGAPIKLIYFILLQKTPGSEPGVFKNAYKMRIKVLTNAYLIRIIRL